MSIWEQNNIVEIIKETDSFTENNSIEKSENQNEAIEKIENQVQEETQKIEKSQTFENQDTETQETQKNEIQENQISENIITANREIGKLVVDTAGFIRHVPLDRYSHHIYTTPDVIEEIRDSRAKSFLKSFPLEIKTVNPTTEAYRVVTDFAMETGDFDALSITDLKVIALAYQLSQESGAEIREKPVMALESENKGKPKHSNYFNPKAGFGDDDGWITPENVKEFTTSYSGVADIPDDDFVPVAIMTTDFAMQNVILQMNLRLVTIEGLQVRSLQKWTKRCYGCEYITKNMSDVFCPICGGPTLEKVSYSINPDGTTHYNLPKRSRSLKGTIYPIPRPKGGRRNNDLILRPDQMPQQAARKRKLASNYSAFDDFDDFGTRKTAKQQPVVGYGKKNPNKSRRKIGKKNKSKLRGF